MVVSMIGIKTQEQKFLNLSLDIEKLKSALPSTLCLVTKQPNTALQRTEQRL